MASFLNDLDDLEEVLDRLKAGYYGEGWMDYCLVGSVPDRYRCNRVYRDPKKLDKFLNRAKQESSKYHRSITFCSDSTGFVAVITESKVTDND